VNQVRAKATQQDRCHLFRGDVLHLNAELGRPEITARRQSPPNHQLHTDNVSNAKGMTLYVLHPQTETEGSLAILRVKLTEDLRKLVIDFQLSGGKESWSWW